MSHPNPATGASAYVVAQNSTSATCRATSVTLLAGHQTQQRDHRFEREPAPRGHRREHPQTWRFDEGRRMQQLGAFRQRLQEFAVLRHLIRRQAAEHHRCIGKPLVGQERHPEEAAIQVVRRQHRLPQDRHRERRTEEPSAARCQRRRGRRGPRAPVQSPGTNRPGDRCGCRTSGQTTTIRAVASIASNNQVIGARLTRADDQRQTGRSQGEGRHPPDIERPQQQNDGGQLQHGVGDADIVTGGIAPVASTRNLESRRSWSVAVSVPGA